MYKGVDVNLLVRIQEQVSELSKANPRWYRSRMEELADKLGCSKIAVGIFFELAYHNSYATRHKWVSKKQGYTVYNILTPDIIILLIPKHGGIYRVRGLVAELSRPFDAKDIASLCTIAKSNVYSILDGLVEEGIIQVQSTSPKTWKTIYK